MSNKCDTEAIKTVIPFIVSAQLAILGACTDTYTPPSIDTSGWITIDSETPSKPSIEEPKEYCGDNKLSGNEVCDGILFNYPKECASYGYASGLVKCTPTCSLDYSDCVTNPNINPKPIEKDPVCGNGIIEDGESCDPNFKKEIGNCSSFGDYIDGQVICSDTCSLDFSRCVKETPIPEPPTPVPVCGNGVKEDGEECDDGNTINTDFCTNSCTIAKCGDNIINNGEECDGSQFTVPSCSFYNPNYDMGTLKCTSSCTIDFSECSISPTCGDGVINTPTEECDGDIEDHSCSDIYSVGTFTGFPKCTACKIDYSTCEEICPTDKEFKAGKYTNGSKTIHKVTKDGVDYIVYDIKVGKIIDSSTVQWINSPVGDEGYYTYFKIESCDCHSCKIAMSEMPFLNKSDVKSVTSVKYDYSDPVVDTLPTIGYFPITIPEDMRTTGKTYQSCIYEGCVDSDTYNLSIASSEIKMSVGSSTYNFTSIRDLGQGVFLVYYTSGSNLPQDLQDAGITNPFAVIKISHSDAYRICDLFDNYDITVQILSWSPYRDVAIATADFNSLASYTYKPVVKATETRCDNIEKDPFKVHLIPTDSTPYENQYSLYQDYIEITYNICYNKNRIQSSSTSNHTNSYEAVVKLVDSVGKDVYVSKYRPNTIVFEGNYSLFVNEQYPVKQLSSKYVEKENYGMMMFEVTFENKKPTSHPDNYLLEQILNCSTTTYSPHESAQYLYCDFSSVTSFLYYEKITFCQTQLSSMYKECFDMKPTRSLAYFNSNYISFPTNQLCTPMFQ